jgi:hypothetical protein
MLAEADLDIKLQSIFLGQGPQHVDLYQGFTSG